MWKHPKQRNAMPQRVMCDKETQWKLMKEFHESLWARGQIVWITFSIVKER